MSQRDTIRGFAVAVLACALVVGAVVAAAIVDQSFGWDDALGLSLFLGSLEIGFFAVRGCHRYQYS